MQRLIDALEQFQTTFKGPCNHTPTLLPFEDYELRYKLLREENQEYLDACNNGDEVEVLDALVDSLFVIMGSFVAHGMQGILLEAFNEVAKSNMSKTDENGNPIINGENGVHDPTRPLGKVLKSDRYFAPRLKQILESGKRQPIISELLQLLTEREIKEGLLKNSNDFAKSLQYTSDLSHLDELIRNTQDKFIKHQIVIQNS